MIKTIAIIVTYNPDIDVLCHQKATLEKEVHRIIYVDNSSINKNDIKETIGEALFISLNKNVGIAKAQNIGIEQAKQSDATHIVFFDQDSIPTDGMIDEILEGFKSNNNIGAVGASYINAFTSNVECFGIKIKGIKLKKKFLTDRYTEVSYIISSGSIIPIKVLNDVGLMREDMFIDGVDFEWCLRAKSKGYAILQARDAHLIHELGNGSKDKVLNHSPFREYYILQNSLRMVRMKHIPKGYRLRRMLMSIGRIISNCRPSRFEYFRQDMRALRDLLR